MHAMFITICTSIKNKKFAIIEFVEENSTVEIVPCCWILSNSESEQFISHWPGYANASKYIMTQKPPNNDWVKYVCIPRKFFGKSF